jgi:hypothetical protein
VRGWRLRDLLRLMRMWMLSSAMACAQALSVLVFDSDRKLVISRCRTCSCNMGCESVVRVGVSALGHQDLRFGDWEARA